MVMVATKRALSQHLQEVEDRRETWIPKIQKSLSEQFNSARKLEPMAVATHIQSLGDGLQTSVHQAYHDAGSVFAEHTLDSLNSRSHGRSVSPDDTHYKAAYDAFMNTYLSNHVPTFVDRLTGSVSARLDTLLEKAGRKAAPKAPTTPYPTDDYDDESDEDLDGSISGPDLSGLVDGLLDSAALIAAGMIVVGASGLAGLASANAYSETTNLDLIKSWSAIEDKVTRPTHSDADGQEQALDDPFQVGDSELMFPLDESLGADISEIIFCRCVVMFDFAGAMHLRRPRTWADRMREIVIVNLPRVVGQEAHNV